MTSVWKISFKKRELIFKKYPVPESKKSVGKKFKKK